MRRRGLKMLAIGLPVFVVGVLFFSLLLEWTIETFGVAVGDHVYVPKPVAFILGAPMAGGYCLTVVGSYRVLFGDRGQGKSALASLGRIVYGLAVTIGFCIGALMIAAMVGRS